MNVCSVIEARILPMHKNQLEKNNHVMIKVLITAFKLLFRLFTIVTSILIKRTNIL